MSRHAKPDHPIHDLIVRRWSPYGFADRPVSAEDLRSLFEAARWAASSYNEQPWRFIIATRDDPAAFERLLGCLVEPNQAWARLAPVLALGVYQKTFARNGNDNRVAPHDLGLAVAQLTMEATARGLSVHQMAGIEPEKAAATYNVPDDAQVTTAFAIGYESAGDSRLAEGYRERDAAERTRKPLNALVFGDAFGTPHSLFE